MPILGIMASSITASTLGDFESIATVLVPSGAGSTVEFTSIPSTYKHLQVRIMSRDARAVTVNTLNVRLGSGSLDTGSNYSSHFIGGSGSGLLVGAQSNGSLMTYLLETGSSASANIFGVNIIDILDYADTNKYTTIRSLGGADLNGSGNINLSSGSWRNTAAVTNIGFINNNTENFAENSHFALYGIKG
jgi:hypothetical protein